jgi:hypothetical protein
VVASGVVDAESGDDPLGFRVGDELGDRFLARPLGIISASSSWVRENSLARASRICVLVRS